MSRTSVNGLTTAVVSLQTDLSSDMTILRCGGGGWEAGRVRLRWGAGHCSVGKMPYSSDVLERPYTVGGVGVPLAGPPPLLRFQFLRLTAKILLWRLRCQEDLSLNFFGPPLLGTIGGP